MDLYRKGGNNFNFSCSGCGFWKLGVKFYMINCNPINLIIFITSLNKNKFEVIDSTILQSYRLDTDTPASVFNGDYEVRE